MHDFLELLTVSGAGVVRPVASAESAALICRQRTLNCEPGSAMVYSAGGFLILSLILERLAGKPMETLLEERLFRPLGMTTTQLMRADNMVVADMAAPYLGRPDGSFVRGGWGLEVNCEGAIVASLDDMVRWARNLLRPTVGGGALIEQMTAATIYTHGARGIYGLGLCTGSYRGTPWFGHGGRYPGFRAELACYPAPRPGDRAAHQRRHDRAV